MNDEPVIVVGHLETRIILRQLESHWQSEVGSVLKMNFGSEMSKDICLQQLLDRLTKKGESHLYPTDDKKMLWMMRQLETQRIQSGGCLITMLCDMAKTKTIYSRDTGFRRKRMADVSLVGQIDRAKGTETLSSFDDLHYFHLISAKGCNPNVIVNPSNFDASIPEDICAMTLAIYLDLGSALAHISPSSENPAKLLSLSHLENIIRCLKVNAQDPDDARKQWKKTLSTHLYVPLWTSKDRKKMEEIFKKHDVILPPPSNNFIFDQVFNLLSHKMI